MGEAVNRDPVRVCSLRVLGSGWLAVVAGLGQLQAPVAILVTGQGEKMSGCGELANTLTRELVREPPGSLTTDLTSEITQNKLQDS